MNPRAQYPWINPNTLDPYQLTDGLHTLLLTKLPTPISIQGLMHDALQIPEILDLILQYTDARTGAACARVCRMWHSPALDSVWYTLHRLDALFRLLGPMHVNSQGKYCFTQLHISPARWARFFFYATRTRRLRYATNPQKFELLHPHAFSAIALARPTFHLLPNLTHLEWHHPSSKLSTLFLSPQLKSFVIRFYPTPRDFPSSELLAHVAVRAPNLECLEIVSEGWGTPEFDGALATTLGALQKLRLVTLSNGFLTPKVLLALAAHPLLKALVQVQDLRSSTGMPKFVPLRIRPGSFINLNELRFEDISLVDVITLLRHPFPAAQLRKLVVTSPTEESPDSISSFFRSVGVHCVGLQTLELTAARIRVHPVPESLPFSALEPLMACIQLVTLSIDMPLLLDIGDTELIQLATAWPEIRKLHLVPQPYPHLCPYPAHSMRPTLGVLDLLANVRPEIEYLGIYIHPVFPSPPTPPHGPRLRPRPLWNLQYLVLGTDSVEYTPDSLAYFLAEVTPPFCVFLVEYFRKHARFGYGHGVEISPGRRLGDVAEWLRGTLKRVPMMRGLLRPSG